METIGFVFQAVVALSAFGGLGLGIWNAWKARTKRAPLFEKSIKANGDYWTVKWTVRNIADIAIEVQGISDIDAPFAIENELPLTNDPMIIPDRRDPRRASFATGQREISIPIPPKSAAEKSLKTYFDTDPSNRSMVFHWRWTHESKPNSSRIRM